MFNELMIDDHNDWDEPFVVSSDGIKDFRGYRTLEIIKEIDKKEYDKYLEDE